MKSGQHFLVNKNKLRKIVETLDLENGDTIVEIGAGHGELTENIKNQSFDKLRIDPEQSRTGQISKIKIIAIEKDKNLVNLLKKKFLGNKNVEIVEGDALKIIPKLTPNYQLPATNYKLAGNIPYYISGYLLRIIGDLKYKPKIAVLTLQKEVAERICALRQAQGKLLRQAQGRPLMNLLAASVQFWAEPKIVGYINKKYFRPVPQVDSAIIKLTVKKELPNYLLPTTYYSFTRTLFRQPRKTVINNLKAGIKSQISKEKIAEKLGELRINPQSRPANLDIDKILQLARVFSTFF